MWLLKYKLGNKKERFNQIGRWIVWKLCYLWSSYIKDPKEQYYQGRMNSFRFKDFPGGSDGKASAYNVGDLGSIPGLGRSPGEGNGNPFQYSCLKNPTEGEIW